MELPQLKSSLESLLFINERPIDIAELTDVLGAERKTIAAALEELRQEYQQRNSGVCIVQVAGGYQMCSAPANEIWVKKMYQERNKWIIFFMLKHGLRVTELVKMEWSQIDFNRRLLTVKRLKSGKTSTHKLSLGQIDFLMSLQKKNWINSKFVFINHHTHRYITAGSINRMIRKAGEHAGLDYMKLHSHMMRHSCGHYLIENEERAVG